MMQPLYSVFPEIAQRETRAAIVPITQGNTPMGRYAFLELYYNDPGCDCRRVLIQVVEESDYQTILATINFGWESAEFYARRLGGDEKSAAEIRAASLDPLNPQSSLAESMLALFRHNVRADPSYVDRLARHYRMFKEATTPSASGAGAELSPAPQEPAPRTPQSDAGDSPLLHHYTSIHQRIPKDRGERYDEVVAMIRSFGQEHLDVELTGFVLELWTRICRRKTNDCRCGKPEVCAAAATHVIARMNFLFDKSQPVHLTFDTICDFFQAKKTTVGGKASEIERTLRLRQHNELGLCRRDILETFTNVRFSNGIVLSWKSAKDMNYLPPDARIEDLF
jgi:hypothetical protein